MGGAKLQETKGLFHSLISDLFWYVTVPGIFLSTQGVSVNKLFSFLELNSSKGDYMYII